MSRTMTAIKCYLVFGLPFIVLAFHWYGSPKDSSLVHIIHVLLVLNVFVWTMCLISFVTRCAVKLTLNRFANIKERDEREQYITGRAARVTYLSSLAIMVILFFNNMVTISFVKWPNEQVRINITTHLASVMILICWKRNPMQL